MILNFDNWNTVNEAQDTISEAAGISAAIKNHIEKFVRDHEDGSFEDASEYIASKVEGWKLSKEDFEEAKAMVKEAKDEFEETEEENDADDADFQDDDEA
jgi:Arc/MetJ-type ribon-helix-helix transcriptional regulator